MRRISQHTHDRNGKKDEISTLWIDKGTMDLFFRVSENVCVFLCLAAPICLAAAGSSFVDKVFEPLPLNTWFDKKRWSFILLYV